MSRYVCQRKIRTLADNYAGITSGEHPYFVFDDVRYEPWEFTFADGSKEHAWLASYEVDAENVNEAHDNFRAKLIDTIPKISLISQCYIEFLHQPFIIHRQDKNYAYFYNIFNSNPVPLHFDDDSLRALEKLKESTINREFFYYWNDATNSVGATSKLLLLFCALEALCKTESGELDRTKRVKIIGEELDTKFFENGNRGLRHRLVHGEYVQGTDFDKDYVLMVHEKVRDYFNAYVLREELITSGVVGPQRHFDDNRLYSANFVKPTSNKFNLLLRDLVEDYDVSEDKFKGKFDFVFDTQLSEY